MVRERIRPSGDPAPAAGRQDRNLTRGMVDTLGKAIVTGGYKDRPFPTEADISKEHGVSRSVTREAVKMLTAKGLLSARPRQGTVIQPEASWNLFDTDVLHWTLERTFSVDLLRQFNELRIAIEPEAAALAAARRDEADLAQIRSDLARMSAAGPSAANGLDADISFHLAILNAARNQFYLQFKPVVETALKTSIHFTNRISGRMASIPDHRAVAEAIEARDPDLARRSMRKLIGDVLGLMDRAGDDVDAA